MSEHLAERGGEKIAARGAIANMKKLSAGVVLLVVLSIGFALIPAVSAVDSDGDGITDAEEGILGTNPNVWTNTDGMVYTEASVYPGLINPGETTTVTLRAIANITTEKREVDVVLVTDLSGSMNADKLIAAKDALKTFVGLADNKTFIGLASFGNASKLYSDATMVKYNDGNNSKFNPYEDFYDSSNTHPNQYSAYDCNGYSDAHIDMSSAYFIQNKADLNSTINSYAARGGTNIAGGINAAKKMFEGHPGHLQVIVVMSDGNATMAPIEPGSLDAYMPSDWISDESETAKTAAVKAAEVVKNNDITVYAIGFGNGADETTLRDVASTGNYYFAPNNTMLAEIYSKISGEIKEITGARAYHVLPADVDYVTGSASAELIVNSQTKTLEWIIGDLAPDAPWAVTFKVKPLNLGNHSVNVVLDSKVTYTSDSIPGSVSFPALFVAVTTLPVAEFDFSWASEESQPHKRETVTFDASASYDPDGGSIVSYDWDFDDGHTGSGETVTHAFDKGRNYTVTLTVTDDEGEIAEVSEDVGVDDNLPPVAVAKAMGNVTDGWQYENITVLQYEPVMFDSSDSYDPDGYIINYRWDFGDVEDGNKLTLAGPLHVYWKNGTYTVTLTVEDNLGKWSELDTFMVNVTPNNNYNESFANVSKNFTVEEDSDVNTTTGKPVSGIGNPVNIFVHTTADNVSVINYSVFVDGCEIATGNEQEMKNFMWISMSSGKHEIKVRAYFEGNKSYEWVLDVVNVWIKPVGD